MSKEQVLQELTKLKKHKKSTSYYALKLGLTEVEIKHYLQELKKINPKYKEATVSMLENSREQKINTEKGTLESTVLSDFEPRNDEELATLHKVDLSKYKISSYWTKQKGDKFTSSLLCSLKKPQDFSPEEFANFLKGYKPSPISITTSTKYGKMEKVDIEISIADFHLAKKTLEGESIETKKEQYLNVLLDLLEKVTRVYQIGKIVFPISNDFFHTDNYQNQTTAGTPQDVLVGYDNEYEEGFDLLATAIALLSFTAEEVEVILVQGNHDRTKSFYLAHALDLAFTSDKKVSFKREHSTTKSTVLGNTFIGYHHGNTKLDELPLLFATGKDAKDFGNATYREVHTGDKHHYMAKEVKGVRIQQMPSLSGTDRWHADNNYVNNVRAGLVLIYHATNGKIGEFESRI